MPRRTLHPVALALIGLGVIGFLFSLLTNPLRMLGIFAGAALLAVIGILLYKWYMNKKPKGNMSNYRRAAKQSAKKYKKQQQKPRSPSHLKVVNTKKITPQKHQKMSLQKRKKDHHLKVIDGKKNKKKNRA